jgi:hypothetical protein
MAYLSDIDLATLHKKRLDEKNHYKLSWYNRRFYDADLTHEELKHEEHKVKSKVGISEKPTKAKANAKAPAKSARVANDGNRDNIALDGDVKRAVSCKVPSTSGCRNHSPDFYDEGYFSSPTLNRRRSGTWP